MLEAQHISFRYILVVIGKVWELVQIRTFSYLETDEKINFQMLSTNYNLKMSPKIKLSIQTTFPITSTMTLPFLLKTAILTNQQFWRIQLFRNSVLTEQTLRYRKSNLGLMKVSSRKSVKCDKIWLQ